MCLSPSWGSELLWRAGEDTVSWCLQSQRGAWQGESAPKAYLEDLELSYLPHETLCSGRAGAVDMY